MRPPRRFNDFIGQGRLLGLLKKLVEGARARGSAIRSMLIVGGPGQGKSALAQALAREYGGEGESETPTFHRLIAGRGISAKAICERLRLLKFGDIVFIDEAHSLNPDSQETLYIALDEWKIFASTEDGKLDRATFTSVAQFALILATTLPGLILPPLRDRLTRVELDPYLVEELKAIAEAAAKSSGVEITPQAARFLAKRSQGSPRQICQAIDLMITLNPNVTEFNLDHGRDFFTALGIDSNGLTLLQQGYLRILATTSNRMASLERLASALSIDGAFVRRDVEMFLVTEGFITITPRGRRITDKGLAAVQEMAQSNGGNDS